MKIKVSVLVVAITTAIAGVNSASADVRESNDIELSTKRSIDKHVFVSRKSPIVDVKASNYIPKTLNVKPTVAVRSKSKPSKSIANEDLGKRLLASRKQKREETILNPSVGAASNDEKFWAVPPRMTIVKTDDNGRKTTEYSWWVPPNSISSEDMSNSQPRASTDISTQIQSSEDMSNSQTTSSSLVSTQTESSVNSISSSQISTSPIGPSSITSSSSTSHSSRSGPTIDNYLNNNINTSTSDNRPSPFTVRVESMSLNGANGLHIANPVKFNFKTISSVLLEIFTGLLVIL